MNTNNLMEIMREYKSYEGTGNNKTNKIGVSVQQFESVLNAALSLSQEVDDLKEELRSKPVSHEKIQLTKQEELEDRFLYCDDDPDDMKQAADFARYG